MVDPVPSVVGMTVECSATFEPAIVVNLLLPLPACATGIVSLPGGASSQEWVPVP
jgi:hypothetical protein